MCRLRNDTHSCMIFLNKVKEALKCIVILIPLETGYYHFIIITIINPIQLNNDFKPIAVWPPSSYSVMVL